MRRCDFANAVANGPLRDDSPRFPERCQADLEGELDRSIHLRVADPRRGSVGPQHSGRRPAEVPTEDRVALFDRTAEGRLAFEQGAAGALPESPLAREYEDRPGTAPRDPSPCDAAQVRFAAPVGVQGLDDLITAGDDEHKPVVVVAAPRAGRVGQVDEAKVT